MAATISFHNGTSVHRGHNRRDKWIADKESHIDPNGHFEIWHDEKLTDGIVQAGNESKNFTIDYHYETIQNYRSRHFQRLRNSCTYFGCTHRIGFCYASREDQF